MVRNHFVYAIASVLFLLIPCADSFSSSTTEYAKAMEYLNTRNEVYFRFYIQDHSILKKLVNSVSVDRMEGTGVTAYASTDEFKEFLRYDLPYEVLTPPSMLFDPPLSDYKDMDLSKPFQIDKYWTYQGYIDMINKFQADFPDLVKVQDFGKTVAAHTIYIVTVTKGVQQKAPKPMFFATGNIHGDETEGSVLLLNLISHLATNYGKDPQATRILDSSIIACSPITNPDGLYARGDNSIQGATRANKNGKDLNRSFPNPVNGFPNPLQPETKAVMDFEKQFNNIVMYADFHGGITILMYPWSSITNTVPDLTWWKYVLGIYQAAAQKEKPGYLNKIGNHYKDLYQAVGTTMDWMYGFRHSRAAILELWSPKVIPENTLKDFWRYNKQAMLDYIEQVRYGIRGFVTDSITGKPIAAKVFVESHDKDSSWVFATPDFGDYYRPIAPGTYSVSYSHKDYNSRTVQGIATENNKATMVNVKLWPKVTPVGFHAGHGSALDAAVAQTHGGITVSLNGLRGTATATVYDIQGKVVRRHTCIQGKTFPVFNVSNGCYIISLVCGDQRQVFRTVVDK